LNSAVLDEGLRLIQLEDRPNFPETPIFPMPPDGLAASSEMIVRPLARVAGVRHARYESPFFERLVMKRLSMLSMLVLGALVVATAHSQNPQAQKSGKPAQRPANAGALPAGQAPAPGALDPAEYQRQVSYALGKQFGMNLKQNEISCDLEALAAGIADVINEAPPKYTDEQLQTCMQRFMGEMQQKGMARIEKMAAANKQQEDSFLTKNKTAEGVQVTPSGLQYKVIQSGTGPSPTLADTVRCNYRGTLLNGTEFDSSEAQGGPVEFPVRGVIPGWTEALQKMKVGDKWQLFVPSELAYGMQPPPDAPIEPGSMLIFDIELLGIAP
jgi:FKBP-type peptidyl-prolyl cis-trans isomerase FklB